MIAQSARAQSNLKLNLTPNSVLYNILTRDDCKNINEIVCIEDLETSLKDLLSVDQHLHEHPSCKDSDPVNIFISEVLNDILKCLPSFIGGLQYHDVEVVKDKTQITWDISTLDPLFEKI